MYAPAAVHATAVGVPVLAYPAAHASVTSKLAAVRSPTVSVYPVNVGAVHSNAVIIHKGGVEGGQRK